MQKFTRILQEEYKRYPILILKRDKGQEASSTTEHSKSIPKQNPTYELYGEAQKIDINKNNRRRKMARNWQVISEVESLIRLRL